ncbi:MULTISPECIES: MAB_1171c family putative transporter [unclassified Streptomyces]|uniref:MAB_1171c family putative transporter n=1 Tax=unclassified Streptomyces TaxID=2593676 RepID=UPI00342399E3
MFQMPLIILLGIGVLWKGCDLARAPHDRVLRFLVTSLLLLMAGEILSFHEVNAAIDRATTAGVGKLVFNEVYLTGLFTLILVFVSATPGPEADYRRHLRINAGLLAGVLAILVIAMLATPAGMRGHSLSTPDMAEPPIASFYFVGNTYFVYGYLASGLWALRYARRASRNLGLGLLTMGLGLLGLTVTAVNRLLLVALRIDQPGSHKEFNTVNWSLSEWSMGVVLMGICYTGAVQLVTRVRSVVHHRRMYHELDPLWRALTAAFPELVLSRPTSESRWRSARRSRSHERRFYRRLIECRDGLVRLSPYLARVAPDADLARAPAGQLARHLTEALAMKPPTESPHTELPAALVASPAGSDLDADARELIALSHALRERTS